MLTENTESLSGSIGSMPGSQKEDYFQNNFSLILRNSEKFRKKNFISQGSKFRLFGALKIDPVYFGNR